MLFLIRGKDWEGKDRVGEIKDCIVKQDGME